MSGTKTTLFLSNGEAHVYWESEIADDGFNRSLGIYQVKKTDGTVRVYPLASIVYAETESRTRDHPED